LHGDIARPSFETPLAHDQLDSRQAQPP
jgi:hypothetical protein